MSSASKNILPDEFYTATTFFTLSGAAGAVWLFCAVLANMDSKVLLQPDDYKVIALGLSELIAIVMLLRIKNKKKLNISY